MELELVMSRRTKMTGVPGQDAPTTTETAAMPAATVDNADADLIAWGKQFEELWAIEKQAWKADGWSKDCPCGDCAPCCGECAAHDTGLIVDEIAALPAHTVAGMRVKARAIQWITSELQSIGGGGVETDLVKGLMEDLLRKTA